MTSNDLPKHEKTRSGSATVYTFAEPLTAADATAVHRRLAELHPGASIATTGNDTVTVTGAATTSRPKSSGNT